MALPIDEIEPLRKIRMIDNCDIETCIDDIVATCDGDLRGALKALLLVNEQLERELNRVSTLAMPSASRHHTGLAMH